MAERQESITKWVAIVILIIIVAIIIGYVLTILGFLFAIGVMFYLVVGIPLTLVVGFFVLRSRYRKRKRAEEFNRRP